jgi:hypothetical protein
MAAPVDTLSPIPLSPRALKALSDSVDQVQSHVPAGVTATQVLDTFVIVPGDPGAPVAAAAELTEKTFAALYDAHIFRHRPEWAITVLLYSSHAAYAKHLPPNAPQGSYGLYYPSAHTIYVETEGGGTGDYQHELVHSLEDADFPLAPIAINEAVASVFELATITSGADGGPPTIHGLPHFRLQTLRTALSNPARAPLVDLDRVLSITDEKAYQAPSTYSINYACSREMARWLDSRHQLWDLWRTCRENVLDDPTCVQSFTKVTGMTPGAATQPFVQWVQSDEAAQ